MPDPSSPPLTSYPKSVYGYFVRPLTPYDDSGPWSAADAMYDRIIGDIAAGRGRLGPERGSWFDTSIRISPYSEREQDEAVQAERERLRWLFLADGWNRVEFESNPGGVFLRLWALTEPLWVHPLNGATFAPEVRADETGTAAAERIVREGCWRYGRSRRDYIPPFRVAYVEIERPPHRQPVR